jgi:hypothetical protein
MSIHPAAQPQRQPLIRKQLVVALLLLPLTVPFALLHQLAEWWHTRVSGALIQRMRGIAKQRDKFFDAIAAKAPAQMSSKETE